MEHICFSAFSCSLRVHFMTAPKTSVTSRSAEEKKNSSEAPWNCQPGSPWSLKASFSGEKKVLFAWLQEVRGKKVKGRPHKLERQQNNNNKREKWERNKVKRAAPYLSEQISWPGSRYEPHDTYRDQAESCCRCSTVIQLRAAPQSLANKKKKTLTLHQEIAREKRARE